MRICQRAIVLVCLFCSILPAIPLRQVYAESGDGHVRIMQAWQEAASLDVYVNGAKVFENRPYKSVSDYVTLPAGTYRLQVVREGGSLKDAVEAVVIVQPQQDYTVIWATEDSGQPAPTILTDDNIWPSIDSLRIRLINLARKADGLSLVRSDNRSATQVTKPYFDKVGYRGHTNYLALTPGWLNAMVVDEGSKLKQLLKPVQLDGYAVYSVFVFGDASQPDTISVGITIDAAGPLLPATGDELE